MKQFTPFLLFALLIVPPASGIDDVGLTTSDGVDTKLSDYNDQTLLFMAMTTECSSCELQNPYLKEVEQSTTNLTIVSVAVNPRTDDLHSIQEYKSKHDISWTIAVNEKGDMQYKYGISSYPQLYLVDAQGVIQQKWTGVTDTDTMLEEISNYVKVTEVKTQNPLIQHLRENVFFVLTFATVIMVYPVWLIYQKLSAQ